MPNRPQPGRPRRSLLSFAAVALLAGALLAGCGSSGGDDNSGGDGSPAKETTTSAGSTTSGGDASTTVPDTTDDEPPSAAEADVIAAVEGQAAAAARGDAAAFREYLLESCKATTSVDDIKGFLAIFGDDLKNWHVDVKKVVVDPDEPTKAEVTALVVGKDGNPVDMGDGEMSKPETDEWQLEDGTWRTADC